jgi:hypothetical protein
MSEHAVVIDAGSTGSRVLAFSFHRGALDRQLHLVAVSLNFFFFVTHVPANEVRVFFPQQTVFRDKVIETILSKVKCKR